MVGEDKSSDPQLSSITCRVVVIILLAIWSSKMLDEIESGTSIICEICQVSQSRIDQNLTTTDAPSAASFSESLSEKEKSGLIPSSGVTFSQVVRASSCAPRKLELDVVSTIVRVAS